MANKFVFPSRNYKCFLKQVGVLLLVLSLQFCPQQAASLKRVSLLTVFSELAASEPPIAPLFLMNTTCAACHTENNYIVPGVKDDAHPIHSAIISQVLCHHFCHTFIS